MSDKAPQAQSDSGITGHVEPPILIVSLLDGFNPNFIPEYEKEKNNS